MKVAKFYRWTDMNLAESKLFCSDRDITQTCMHLSAARGGAVRDSDPLRFSSVPLLLAIL